jgi:hypothetical protein
MATYAKDLIFVNKHINGTIMEWVNRRADELLNSYPDLSTNRAIGIYSAVFYAEYLREWDDFCVYRRNSAMYHPDGSDDVYFAVCDLNDDHKSVFDILERYNRMLGLEADFYQKYGFEKFDMGRFEPDWKEKYK